MSWSVTASGSPKEVEEQLNSNQYATGEDQSSKEYQDALPKLVGLVQCNKGEGVGLSLSAYGHATTDGKVVVGCDLKYSY